jgi:hypothetical protein
MKPKKYFMETKTVFRKRHPAQSIGHSAGSGIAKRRLVAGIETGLE